MRILIVTQVVDRTDPVLGFFHEWIREFAKHGESVHVICLKEGEYDLPPNVSVHSLGKETGVSRAKYIFRFYKFIWSLRNEYDAVFVHMNPEYVLLGGLWWRLWGKKIGLWYTHKSVTWKLRLAVLFAHSVFTASPESFRLATKKLHVMGHGIPTGHFSHNESINTACRICTIGRLSKTKRVHEMIEAVRVLTKRGVGCVFTIYGAPATEADREYEQMLRREIADLPMVSIAGSVLHADIPKYLADTDLFLNFSMTGSMDKAVLEAWAAGVPTISSNEAFKGELQAYDLFLNSTEADVVASAIERYIKRPDRDLVSQALQANVEKRHSLSRLIPAILEQYKTYVRN